MARHRHQHIARRDLADNVLVSGRLVNGAVASVHIGAIPFAGSGYRMEIYGRAGTLVATG